MGTPDNAEPRTLCEISPGLARYLDDKLPAHPMRDAIENLLVDFSPNGRMVIGSYLSYAQEDEVFDKAWEILQREMRRTYMFQPPEVRGDPDIWQKNELILMVMTHEAGITWPRPKRV